MSEPNQPDDNSSSGPLDINEVHFTMHIVAGISPDEDVLIVQAHARGVTGQAYCSAFGLHFIGDQLPCSYAEFWEEIRGEAFADLLLRIEGGSTQDNAQIR